MKTELRFLEDGDVFLYCGEVYEIREYEDERLICKWGENNNFELNELEKEVDLFEPLHTIDYEDIDEHEEVEKLKLNIFY